MDDELQEIRDNFYVGNFAKALQMCDTTQSTNDITQNECNGLLGRACISLGILDRLKAMQNSECPGQRASALMAVLTKAKNEQTREQARERLTTLAKESPDMTASALAASAVAAEGNWAEAVSMTQLHPTLEMQALRIFFLLMCNQADTAEKRLNEASGSNDDSGAFRLAQAAVHLATGNAEEAYLIYCDLSTQFPASEGDDNGSVLLLTGKAVANMQRGMYAEALEDLQRAHSASPNDPNVLANLCTCSTHLAKKDDWAQYYAKLEQVSPSHPFVQKTQSIKTAFQRFKASQ